MATVYIEQKRREALKAAFQKACDAISDPSSPATPSWSRTELFGTDPKELSHTEKGFQMRTLERLCKQKVFRKVKQPGSSSYRYEVADGDKILQALENEEAFSALVWAKSEKTSVSGATEAPIGTEEVPSEVESSNAVPEAAGPQNPVETDPPPSDAQVQEAILKMVFGLVENMHYMRTKLEVIENHVRELRHSPAKSGASS